MANILIIDNEPSIRAILRAGLEACNHVVYEAGSGEEAIDMEQPVDLILIDHYMDGMSGLEIAAYYRTQGVPFIFVSSASDWDIMQQAIAIGAMDFIKKPFNIEQLVITVEAVLARANDLSRLQQAQRYLSDSSHQERSIHTAIGLMMERFRIHKDEAHLRLATHAEKGGLTITEAASRVIKATNDINSTGS
jgi:DNA-binding response OmpR family regulator